MRAGWLTLIALIAAVLAAGCSMGGDAETESAPGRPLSDRLSLGHSHSCVIDVDDELHCWGANDHGQTTVPDTDASYVAVSAGGWHTCAIDDEDKLRCWGVNDYGQNNVPDPSVSYRAVSAGESFTCAIRSDDDTLDCWGDDANGQVTVPDADASYASVAAGLYHACAIRSGTGQLECWGGGDGYDAGQLADPDATASYSQVTAGFYHTCAIRTSDSGLECWGDNFYDQIDVPDADAAYDFVSAGINHACAMRSGTGRVECWGDSQFRQAADPGQRYRILAAGGSHSCAVRDDTKLICWGRDNFGQSTTPTSLAMSLPLLLRLSVEPTCEVIPVRSTYYDRNRFTKFNADGSRDLDIIRVWSPPEETLTHWWVSGGAGPYTLVIDGESRDPTQEYNGPAGTASVTCALEHGEVIYNTERTLPDRLFYTQPVVDSGWKTVTATVTDSTGATATATTDFYALRRARGGGEVLSAGETYLVHGILLTIPEGQDAEVGGYVVSESSESIFDILFLGYNYHAVASIETHTGAVVAQYIEWLDAKEFAETRAGAVAVSDASNGLVENEYLLEDEADIRARLASLVYSIGKPPKPRGD